MTTTSLQGLIAVRQLFADLDGSFNKKLKSQRGALQMEGAEDYPRVLSYLSRAALIKKFDVRVTDELTDQLKQSLDQAGWNSKLQGPKRLDSEAGYLQSWALFDQLSEEAVAQDCQHPEKWLGMETAKLLLQKGVSELLTHLDKSSELAQKVPVRDSFVSDLLKSMGKGKNAAPRVDASVLIRAPFGSALPMGVTMSAEDQAKLGIVCSSSQSFLSAAGNAAGAPLQQMFMTRFAEPGGMPISLLDVFLGDDLGCLSKMLGVSHLTQDVLRSYLGNADGPLAFYASLYFGLRQLAGGGFDDEIALIESSCGSLDIDPESLYNTPSGRGIHNVILPSVGGYVHATPLINTGLLKDIHQLRDQAPEKEDPWLWRQMFTRVSVGGSNPQNAGVFFSSVVNGQINALNADLSTQQSAMRLWKQRLRQGRALYWLPKERAMAILPRTSVPGDPTWVDRKIHRLARAALERRIDNWIDDVVDQLATIGEQFTNGGLSVGMINPLAKPDAKAEQCIFLGSAKAEDVAQYARYLCWQLFRSTLMTKAEKHATTDAVYTRLTDRLKAG
jgi:hypothetical protein